MKNRNKQMGRILKEKQERRQALADLPIEEKFRILIELQKMASPILRSRGVERTPWMIGENSEMFQIQERDPVCVHILPVIWWRFEMPYQSVNPPKDIWSRSFDISSRDVHTSSFGWKGLS